jgi:hypothetical protein
MTLSELDQARADDALNRMKELDDCLTAAAELLYRARALAKVDSLAVPFGALPVAQQIKHKTEMWNLVFQTHPITFEDRSEK